MNKKTIVITGCSSGFGRATALHLVTLGWQVFATVRKEIDRESLLDEVKHTIYKNNLHPLICDITQFDQVAALAQTVSAATSTLDALINNAGTAVAAPLELLDLDDLRTQLEINVIAQISVIQTFLPLLKEVKGTIINVSSVSGQIATPIVGAYVASKFALEGMSDTLRVELAPFGVRVVVIEPSSSPTSIWKTSMQRSLKRLEAYRNGSYGKLLNTFEKIAKRSATSGFPAHLFVDTVVHILNSRNPRARYVVPRNIALQILLRRLLPDSFWDRQLRRMLRW